MAEEIMMGDRPYKPAPLSPRQKHAAFRDVGKSGNEIVGEFADGAEEASYTMKGVIAGDPEITVLRVFIRKGMDMPLAAKMLRQMANRLEEDRF